MIILVHNQNIAVAVTKRLTTRPDAQEPTSKGDKDIESFPGLATIANNNLSKGDYKNDNNQDNTIR